MRIVGLPKGFYYLSKNRPIELSELAQQRLQGLNPPGRTDDRDRIRPAHGSLL